jgi:hypothetical protein
MPVNLLTHKTKQRRNRGAALTSSTGSSPEPPKIGDDRSSDKDS